MPARRHATVPAALTLVLAAAACADRSDPVAPDRPTSAGAPAAAATAGQESRARHERMARRLALALRDDGFRSEVRRALDASTEREGKVHLQAFLASGTAARRLAALSGTTEAEVLADLPAAEPIEIYLPVPSHRTAWRGGTELLVATSEEDADAPVAFDLWGRRRVLSAAQPPAEPVLGLGRAEARFATAPAAVFCDGCFYEEEPIGGGIDGGTGGGGTAALVSPGLYMTYARFTKSFEGWLKGSPEFEVHILGQEGTGNALKSYQCAGEHAGGPYVFDQNELTWSGRVALFSQAQFDDYRAKHPGQAYRVFVVEDDDGACAIKADSAHFTNLIRTIEANIGPVTGGFDSLRTVGRAFKAARSGWNILKALWSLITTQDELVGNAVEDFIAKEWVSGANWIVRGDNNITTGVLKLEMVNP